MGYFSVFISAVEMSCRHIVDLSSDDEAGPVDLKAIKLEPDSVGSTFLQKYYHNQTSGHGESKTQLRRQESEENKSSNGQSINSVLEQGQSPIDDTGISSTSSICPPPLCRQFWKAGNYEDGLGSKVKFQNGKNFLHVHPLFLHSNATSHKWAFGAVAELLDNAVDEIQNGATFVIVDKTTNPRDGSPALLFQDDGGGMDPEAMRNCMSFGFSDKKLKSAIGKYGNGFKTSSMRLGADAVVFSRHVNDRTFTQSIGLLSYTFLTQTGLDRIIVPMVDYEFKASTGTLQKLNDREHFESNLSLMLQWSPFPSEAELLKQFDDIGPHGTKIIIYNLWFSDDGNTELDFDSDPEDIQINVGIISKKKSITEQHIASRFHYSLRVYLSILYLRIPESFNIILRGRIVEHHNIANDLKFPEFILYRPHSGGCVEGTVITTIGFLKEAPHVNIHGFCVYHKNRLILPYWKVITYCGNSRGRGVVGVLEANFVEPTHNKQDFERTSLFQKLETRLKEMQWEYWDFHCALIGYQAHKKPRATVASQDTPHSAPPRNIKPVVLNQSSIAVGRAKASNPSHSLVGRAEQLIPSSQGTTKLGSRKRKAHGELLEFENVVKHSVEATSVSDAGQNLATQSRSHEAINLMHENKKLHANCLEYDKRIEELNHKVTRLQSELEELEREYKQQFTELEALDAIKEERKV
ncbi:protein MICRORCHIDIA 6-like isoform X3 [Mangifera indica]|uniref:protein MICRORCHIDIA 6-like isoform X3 n=1 Tax=Mangifera indica TaxID=29780 RepID=UPI001CFB843F|nr:protein MICRORCHIDIA 6-like isoform X3 [Mangifera indica]